MNWSEHDFSTWIKGTISKGSRVYAVFSWPPPWKPVLQKMPAGLPASFCDTHSSWVASKKARNWAAIMPNREGEPKIKPSASASCSGLITATSASLGGAFIFSNTRSGSVSGICSTREDINLNLKPLSQVISPPPLIYHSYPFFSLPYPIVQHCIVLHFWCHPNCVMNLQSETSYNTLQIYIFYFYNYGHVSVRQFCNVQIKHIDVQCITFSVGNGNWTLRFLWFQFLLLGMEKHFLRWNVFLALVKNHRKWFFTSWSDFSKNGWKHFHRTKLNPFSFSVDNAQNDTSYVKFFFLLFFYFFVFLRDMQSSI